MPEAEWDIFISHASEDKDSFVVPLATTLKEFGARVWFDQFTLKIGDSLARSIDRGLARSAYGAVVLSKLFMSKGWTEYELRGLITREIGKGKVVLPIWHNVTREDVIEFSPSLADKFALSTANLTVEQIAFQLLEVIRPDLHLHLTRRLILNKMQAEGVVEHVALDQIDREGPIIHQTLPASLLLRIKLTQRVLFEVFPESLDQAIEHFRREPDPEREVVVWEAIASAYLDATRDQILSLEQRREIYKALLVYSWGGEPADLQY
ncbi:MAG TPA: toll/interleukin-1 receptor domain-containing protein, partial [Longimicrobium sp.]|nr:toll/interleukin-1 receptor domain-containing protein [Longimicrobium sp.]